MTSVKKILVPTDLSANSLNGIEYGITLSVLYGAELFLLNVMDNGPYEVISRICSDMNELYSAVEKNISFEINQLVSEKISSDIKVTQIVICGQPEVEIVKFAESEKIDLIIMTNKKSIQKSTARHDSVIKKVIRLSNIPVVTINAGGIGEETPLIKIINNKNKKRTSSRSLVF